MQQDRKPGLNPQIQSTTLLVGVVITVLSSGEMMIGVESRDPVEVLLLLGIHPLVLVVSPDPKLPDYINSNSGRNAQYLPPEPEWRVHNGMMESWS